MVIISLIAGNPLELYIPKTRCETRLASHNGEGMVKIIKIGQPYAAKTLYESNVQRPSVRSTPNARWKWETLSRKAEGEDMVCALAKVRELFQRKGFIGFNSRNSDC